MSNFKMKSQYVGILDSRLHYTEIGSGDPIVFIHGIPTWSYLWRNVMPVVAEQGRCIAPDLIGCGKSGKPDIDYSINDHIAYFDAFMHTLNLTNVTLVMHAWGSVVGFDYAKRNPEKIKGLIFLEGHIRAASQPHMVSLPVKDRSTVLHDDDKGYHAIMEENVYVEDIFPQGVMTRLSDDVMAQYRMPFPDVTSRKVIWQYLQDLPLGEQQTNVTKKIDDYSHYLQTSDIPKLMLYAMPGFNTSIETVMWARDHLPKLDIVEIDDALHYAPESHPQELATAIAQWCHSKQT